MNTECGKCGGFMKIRSLDLFLRGSFSFKSHNYPNPSLFSVLGHAGNSSRWAELAGEVVGIALQKE